MENGGHTLRFITLTIRPSVKRIPLDTRDVETARKLRDELFLNWTGKVLPQAA